MKVVLASRIQCSLCAEHEHASHCHAMIIILQSAKWQRSLSAWKEGIIYGNGQRWRTLAEMIGGRTHYVVVSPSLILRAAKA